jgi:acyl dehydratase
VPEPPLVVLAFMGLEWQMVRDVRVGDTISSRARVAAKRPMREGGVVIEEREILDQHGEVVQHGKLTFLVAKRPKEAAA